MLSTHQSESFLSLLAYIWALASQHKDQNQLERLEHQASNLRSHPYTALNYPLTVNEHIRAKDLTNSNFCISASHIYLLYIGAGEIVFT